MWEIAIYYSWSSIHAFCIFVYLCLYPYSRHKSLGTHLNSYPTIFCVKKSDSLVSPSIQRGGRSMSPPLSPWTPPGHDFQHFARWLPPLSIICFRKRRRKWGGGNDSFPPLKPLLESPYHLQCISPSCTPPRKHQNDVMILNNSGLIFSAYIF